MIFYENNQLLQSDVVFDSESNCRNFSSLAPPGGEKKKYFFLQNEVTKRRERFLQHYNLENRNKDENMDESFLLIFCFTVPTSLAPCCRIGLRHFKANEFKHMLYSIQKLLDISIY